MSLSKRLYEEGYTEKLICQFPKLEIGQRFTVNHSYQKNLQGIWEIVCNRDAPFYLCNRVLKNGKLSKSVSLDNRRIIFETNIYEAMRITKDNNF